MPVYEYLCDSCGCRFEEYRDVTQRASCPCPECHAAARKVFRPVGVIFKGSGFHVTDYRKPDEKAKAEREAEREAKAPEPATSKAKKDGD
jgi:putative FmdB family regulatory protein